MTRSCAAHPAGHVAPRGLICDVTTYQALGPDGELVRNDLASAGRAALHTQIDPLLEELEAPWKICAE
jgi:hypothetical protein